MNIQEYISSGILESYALGEGTPEERVAVENALAQYPELRAELEKVEATLEEFALRTALTPRPAVKDNILKAIAAQPAARKPAAKSVDFTPSSAIPWKYAAAASIAIALLSSYLAYDYRSRWIEKEIAYNELSAQNQRVAEDYNVVNRKLDKIQGDLAIIESTAFKKVVMKGTPNAEKALASVYWNESTKEVYLSIQNLKELSKDNQFQLWAIVDGKPVDAGVFDGNFAGLLKMKEISGAAAFAVTIEPRGGLASPTLGTMQVVGTVVAPKS